MLVKKKILLIISNLETGGVSKSITSLMNVIDRDKYDISLMIVSPTGALMSLLPSDLRLITNPVWDYLVSGPSGVIKLFKSGNPLLAIGHIIRLITSVFSKAKAGLLIAKMMPAIDEAFDVIIDYNGQQQLYYMVDKLNAKKKITFFHNDYAKWPYYYSVDKKYFRQVDKIFTVSELCVKSLRHFFPKESDKIGLMENLSPIGLIESLAKEDIQDMSLGTYKLLTVGHVCDRKGIYWALEAASILKNLGIDFHWYFLGSVDKKSEYKTLCNKYGIEENIHFLGIRTNPYPYMRKASIIVHPAKYEGRSIALDEAKILCKPIIVTNFSTVNDQFIDRHNASICEMATQDIAHAIYELCLDKDLQIRYADNLRSELQDNTSEIEKLYAIFDD